MALRCRPVRPCAAHRAAAEACRLACCWLQVVSQVSLLLLLYGTIIGDFALLADVGARAVGKLTPHPPELLVGHGGRGMMVLLALCPVLPLCLLRRCPPWHGLSRPACVLSCTDAPSSTRLHDVPALQGSTSCHATLARASCRAPEGNARVPQPSRQSLTLMANPNSDPTRMRSLETAATAGVVIVLALAGIIVAEALRAGLPAIASGELPLWRLQARAQVSSRASP